MCLNENNDKYPRLYIIINIKRQKKLLYNFTNNYNDSRQNR